MDLTLIQIMYSNILPVSMQVRDGDGGIKLKAINYVYHMTLLLFSG